VAWGGVDGDAGLEVCVPGAEFVVACAGVVFCGAGVYGTEVLELQADVEEEDAVEDGQGEHVDEQEDW